MKDAGGSRLRVDLGAYEVTVEDHGDGVPLILVHGFPLSMAMWDPIRPGLAEVARVITPDLRGFGASDKPMGDYSMVSFADDLLRLIDALGLERIVLGGHSMGGYVALRFASSHRDRLAGLILVDSRAEADPAEGRARRDAAIARIEREGGGGFLDDFVPNLIAESTRTRAPRFLAELRAAAAGVPDHVLIGCLLGMRDRPDSTALLRELDVAALVIVGADDAITPPASAQAMVALLPQATLAVIPGAGHTPPIERPLPTADAMIAFVRRELKPARSTGG
jgi:pimeloyl-ACP methyl ester carboxylesterase